MIPAYSPQARGRSERSFGTWQGRLPQELRLAGIDTLDGANAFLCESYVAEFNEKFTVLAQEKGTAFRKTARTDLNWIFAVQSERVVAQDNTVRMGERVPLAVTMLAKTSTSPPVTTYKSPAGERAI